MPGIGSLYNSVHRGTDSIKVDILLGLDTSSISTERISSGFELLDFVLDYDVTIFSKGSLIGDKMTTLASSTIGIEPGGIRNNDIAKQIYDVALLVKSATVSTFIEAVRTYQNSCNFQCKIRGNFSDERIADDITKS